jgi:GNAT superfamily N-acetyltransferase
MLNKPFAETGPFRAEVLKLFASPTHQRKGIAKLQMVKLEEVARKEGRTLLVCRRLPYRRNMIRDVPICSLMPGCD